jgi:hypothetical protein
MIVFGPKVEGSSSGFRTLMQILVPLVSILLAVFSAFSPTQATQTARKAEFGNASEAQSGDASQKAAPVPSSQPGQSQESNDPHLPRGKKLVLKDGSFQLVREYQVEGDRIRYYSIDQHDWEEMPSALVDWDATKKEEDEETKRKAELIAKVHASDVARHAAPLDIDASIEVAGGIFLPPGEGLFSFDGKSIRQLAQAEADIKFSKSQMLKQVLVPIPIVPTRHTVSLPGTRAKIRVKSGQTEFYMRTADGREPEMDLLRARVHNGKRDLENLDQLFKEEATTGKISLPIQRWEIAHGVYRFTLAQNLEPGEYAMAELVQGGATSLYFWDFGVDAAPSSAAGTSK